MPPDSEEARIRSYECTFCASCVESILGNVCPNCGGRFVPRPIRPSKNWKDDNFFVRDPACTITTHKPVNPEANKTFSSSPRSVPPARR
ncbi:MAG: DUF1272 domain-containing protein [Nitrospira sp.]|nr:DUF1272 domain-containing protein [Nitrospira sp.]MBS0173238.1 DUF1272 domain-containing protein [Nitrospira sp.]MBX3338448.1 DUF1272 domain-containing protein [Nitrospira sp.]MCW5781461.1 DUF1272 domain-containing protein [Nitrospira sp.]MCW5795446.1 DUF1272 domain-containing protein [Nitrospira sp.]